jgi:thiol-disulfide isomerase/thioredoxin
MKAILILSFLNKYLKMKRTYLIVLLTLATFNYVVSQDKSKEESLSEWDEHLNSESEGILKEDLNFKTYLYEGTNLDRKPVDNFEEYPQKIIFYWSSDCRYCKKELDDLEKIISEQPYLKDSILVILRVDKQNKEWSLQKENDFYTLYRNKKDFMRLPVPLLFLSEKILDESSLTGAPHTLFLNSNQEIEFIKSGYLATSRKSELEEVNYEFLKWKINRHLRSGDGG